MPTAKAQPKPLEALLLKFREAIGALTGRLEEGAIDTDAWQAQMEQELKKFHTAAYIAGQGGRQMSLDELARRRISGTVQAQVSFLDRFAVEIQSASEFERGWLKRAESYSDSLTEPFWKGRIKVLPVPSVPGDGSTQCGYHCKCSLSVDMLNEENSDANITWVRHAQDSCQTCIERASQWSPLRIRNGVLQ